MANPKKVVHLSFKDFKNRARSGTVEQRLAQAESDILELIKYMEKQGSAIIGLQESLIKLHERKDNE